MHGKYFNVHKITVTISGLVRRHAEIKPLIRGGNSCNKHGGQGKPVVGHVQSVDWIGRVPWVRVVRAVPPHIVDETGRTAAKAMDSQIFGFIDDYYPVAHIESR